MTRDMVTASWQHYLGGALATSYAAPARAADLSDLPPAYVSTAELDPDRDEGIEYGLRLLQAGVRVELHRGKARPRIPGGRVRPGLAAANRGALRGPAPCAGQ